MVTAWNFHFWPEICLFPSQLGRREIPQTQGGCWVATQMTNARCMHRRASGQSRTWQGTVVGSLSKGHSLQSMSGKSQMAQSLDPRGKGRASTNREQDMQMATHQKSC